jgi:type I restriction enzyme S subunit
MEKQQTKFKQTEIGEIPEDWACLNIGDLVTHKKGFAFKSHEFSSSGHCIVRVSNFTDRSIEIKDCDYMIPEEVEKYNEVKLKFRDVVIATVGSWANSPNSIVGKVIRVPKEADQALLNQNAVIIRPKDNDSLNNDFLFYRLRNKDFSDHLINRAQGSANQASITLSDIFTFSFGLPKVQEQQIIAKILSDLDAKIELNQKMNKALELIGQVLFKSGFTDLEIIPEEWKVVKLGDYVNVIKGVSYRSEELKESDKALVTLKSIERGGGLNKRGFKETERFN